MEERSVKVAAVVYTQAGLHVIPIRGDGSKEPALPTWKEYQDRPATLEEIEQWFDGQQEKGLAILGGNDLEILDFDVADLFPRFAALVAKDAPGLVERLPWVKTPRGGDHLWFIRLMRV